MAVGKVLLCWLSLAASQAVPSTLSTRTSVLMQTRGGHQGTQPWQPYRPDPQEDASQDNSPSRTGGPPGSSPPGGGGVTEEIKETAEDAWEDVRNASKDAAESLSNATEAASESAAHVASRASSAISVAANYIWEHLKSIWKSAKSMWRRRPSASSSISTTTLTTTAAANATGVQSSNCITQKTEYSAWYSSGSVAEAGSHCWFGVDDRDEGYHCIDVDGNLGTNGWCWTANEKTAWGKCGDGCPLAGADKVLADKLDSLNEKVDRLTSDLEHGQ